MKWIVESICTESGGVWTAYIRAYHGRLDKRRGIVASMAKGVGLTAAAAIIAAAQQYEQSRQMITEYESELSRS